MKNKCIKIRSCSKIYIVVDRNEGEKLKKLFVEQLENYVQQNFIKKQHVT